MSFELRKNGLLRKALGEPRAAVVAAAIVELRRLLPHLEFSSPKEVAWSAPGLDFTPAKPKTPKATKRKTQAKKSKTVATLTLGTWTPARSAGRSVQFVVVRLLPRRFPDAPDTRIDGREAAICSAYARALSDLLDLEGAHETWLRTAVDQIAESAVARHLVQYHKLHFDLEGVLRDLHRLAEQSYENKSIAFGYLVDTKLPYKADLERPVFTTRFLGEKKYRALSDGYHTSYVVSRAGRLRAFGTLEAIAESYVGDWYPIWAKDMSGATIAKRGCGLCLTHQGDLLIFDDGDLRFSYRAGRWHYWNHEHLVDVVAAMCRRQRVGRDDVQSLARFIYEVALDVSFRRSGGMLVVLRSAKRLHSLVRPGDAVEDGQRDPVAKEFDKVLVFSGGMAVNRRAVAEIAGLDGAVVFSSNSNIVAYAAILQPKKRGRVGAHEGSRSKAALGASHYGLVLKISSDGDIEAFFDGNKVFKV